jgi:hypothetical protein
MWKKTLLLVVFCLAGLGSLSALLLRRDRIAEPPHLDPGRYGREHYRSVIEQVNGEFHRTWSRDALQPAGPADLLLVARRISLGLTGTVPSLEEIRALEAQPEDLRLEWWMSRLLADRRYSDYVAERLARAFVGTDQGPFLLYRRRRFVTWLSDQLAANRAYDQLVRDLITAKGLWTDAPEVNFLTATADGNEKGQPDDIRLAGRTARAFLAIRIDCLQCHDDKLGTIELGTSSGPRLGAQADFHQLAAFYSQARASLFGIRDGNQDYRYTYLGADDTTLVIPKPPFLDELLPSAATRREQLARWVTHPDNKPFARAAVNRFWAILFGQPLVDPVDSIPLFGPFPPGLETLAEDFTHYGFDVQRLLRVMVAMDAFRRDSQASFEITPAHERAWAAFPLSRLRPEQVAGCIIQSASLSTIDANAHIFSQLGRFFQARDFVERYGDTGEDEFEGQSGTITQRLLLMNGELVKERTKENPLASAATRIAMLAPDDDTALEAAYLAVLTRRPSVRESELWRARLAGTRGKQRQQALEDLYWVLINSSEFSWNH